MKYLLHARLSLIVVLAILWVSPGRAEAVRSWLSDVLTGKPISRYEQALSGDNSRSNIGVSGTAWVYDIALPLAVGSYLEAV